MLQLQDTRIVKFECYILDFDNQFFNLVCKFLKRNSKISRVLFYLESEKFIEKILDTIKYQWILEELYLNTPELISIEIENQIIEFQRWKEFLTIHWNSQNSWLNTEQNLKIEKYYLVFN